MNNIENEDWKVSDPHMFWAEVAPTEHIIQIYENDEVFLNLLESFVINGLKAGDCVVIIATKAHINHLNDRLTEAGVNVASVIADDQYIHLDAEETLAKFMVNGWPDEKLFNQTISQIVKLRD
jgi:hypothetical protein